MLIVHTYQNFHRVPEGAKSQYHENRATVLCEPDRVDFDPTNAEHCSAYMDLVTDGKLSPKFRFNLELPYTDLVAMMSRKMADHWVMHITKQ